MARRRGQVGLFLSGETGSLSRHWALPAASKISKHVDASVFLPSKDDWLLLFASLVGVEVETHSRAGALRPGRAVDDRERGR